MRVRWCLLGVQEGFETDAQTNHAIASFISTYSVNSTIFV